MFKKLKNVIRNYLNKVAKENEELYGKGRMDCCKLNSQKKEVK